MTRTVVIGAGVIGLASAYALATAGHDVVILDAGPIAPGAASRVNAGWVVPSMAGPIPRPGAIRELVSSVLRADRSLSIKADISPSYLRFLLDLSRNCTRAAYLRGLMFNALFSRDAVALYDAWQREGIDTSRRSAGGGVLKLYLDRRALAHDTAAAQEAAQLGTSEVIPLCADDVRDRVPDADKAIVGGLLLGGQQYLSPDDLVDALTAACHRHDVTFAPPSQVTGFRSQAGQVRSVVAGSKWRADHVVIAAGAASGRIAGLAGYSLPVQPGQGLCVDLPAGRTDAALYLVEARIAVTAGPGSTRLAGGMHIGKSVPDTSPKRVLGMQRRAAAYLSDLPALPTRVQAGLRAVTPDGMPIIGRLPTAPNVVVATGHGMLGVTLAPATSSVVRSLIDGHPVPVETHAFAPERFRGR